MIILASDFLKMDLHSSCVVDTSLEMTGLSRGFCTGVTPYGKVVFACINMHTMLFPFDDPAVLIIIVAVIDLRLYYDPYGMFAASTNAVLFSLSG